MAVNDVFHANGVGVAADGEFNITPDDAETGAVEVFEFGGTGPAVVYKEVDVDNDGTYSLSVQVDDLGDGFHSQQNQIVLSDSDGIRLRIVNTAEEAHDYYATGMEVND